MVGGTVEEVIPCAEGTIWVGCVETRPNPPARRPDRCAIYVEATDTAMRIAPGDIVWWQGQDAMWTPAKNRKRPEAELRCGKDFDIRIPRSGYSGVPRPPAEIRDAN